MDLSTITPEPQALRALSHPVRLKILGLLRSDGPSTATALAARLGLNSGATSYHLRQLHQHGFVAEDAERGNRRERWWRAAHQVTRTNRTESDPEERAAADAFAQAVAVIHVEQIQRATEERSLLSPAWRAAAMESDWELRLTAERAAELSQAISALVMGWREASPDEADAAAFTVMLHAFPRPGSEPAPAAPKPGS